MPRPTIHVSKVMEKSFSGLTQVLTCTATVINAIPSSLVVLKWTKHDDGSNTSFPEPPRVTISNQTITGSQYTKVVRFSPLLNKDGGHYTCSVSVDGFTEASNQYTILISVNGMLNVTFLKCGYMNEIANKNRDFLCVHYYIYI